MKTNIDFITYALERADRSTVPNGAELPIPLNRVGTAVGAPWVYLWGTTGQKVTQALLDERYKNHYSKNGWTEAEWKRATAGWVEEGRWATDCEGLFDSFLGVDVNANYNYTAWCTEKGKISDINRPWVIGEAVFRQSKTGSNMVHVGWICGFLNGQPLVVEAKGVWFGVRVTKPGESQWTHRGLMTKKIQYEDTPAPTTKIYYNKVTSPMSTGEPYKAMQHALNLGGYGPLDEDGKWGKKSLAAFQDMVKYNLQN